MKLIRWSPIYQTIVNWSRGMKWKRQRVTLKRTLLIVSEYNPVPFLQALWNVIFAGTFFFSSILLVIVHKIKFSFNESWNSCLWKKNFNVCVLLYFSFASVRWDFILRLLCSQVGAFQISLFHFSVCCFPFLFSLHQYCCTIHFLILVSFFSFLSLAVMILSNTIDMFPANLTRNFISVKRK